jgi:signal peptidase I
VAVAATASTGAGGGLSADFDRSPTPSEVASNLRRLGITARVGDRSYRIPSSAMEPTLHCARPVVFCEAVTEDRVVARPYSSGRRPRRGDIIVFTASAAAEARCGTAGTYVKRLVGLPGETISEDRMGFLYADGRKLREPYVEPARRRQDVDFRGRSWRVRSRAFFVMGDNRGQSCDSRVFGPVHRASIIGRVIAIYWPTSRLRRL